MLDQRRKTGTEGRVLLTGRQGVGIIAGVEGDLQSRALYRRDCRAALAMTGDLGRRDCRVAVVFGMTI